MQFAITIGLALIGGVLGGAVYCIWLNGRNTAFGFLAGCIGAVIILLLTKRTI